MVDVRSYPLPQSFRLPIQPEWLEKFPFHLLTPLELMNEATFQNVPCDAHQLTLKWQLDRSTVFTERVAGLMAELIRHNHCRQPMTQSGHEIGPNIARPDLEKLWHLIPEVTPTDNPYKNMPASLLRMLFSRRHVGNIDELYRQDQLNRGIIKQVFDGVRSRRMADQLILSAFAVYHGLTLTEKHAAMEPSDLEMYLLYRLSPKKHVDLINALKPSVIDFILGDSSLLKVMSLAEKKGVLLSDTYPDLGPRMERMKQIESSPFATQIWQLYGAQTDVARITVLQRKPWPAERTLLTLSEDNVDSVIKNWGFRPGTNDKIKYVSEALTTCRPTGQWLWYPFSLATLMFCSNPMKMLESLSDEEIVNLTGAEIPCSSRVELLMKTVEGLHNPIFFISSHDNTIRHGTLFENVPCPIPPSPAPTVEPVKRKRKHRPVNPYDWQTVPIKPKNDRRNKPSH